MHGKVVRPLRSVNPDQNDYCGLIQVKNEDGSGKLILFEIIFFSCFNEIDSKFHQLNKKVAIVTNLARAGLHAMAEMTLIKGSHNFEIK